MAQVSGEDMHDVRLIERWLPIAALVPLSDLNALETLEDRLDALEALAGRACVRSITGPCTASMPISR